MSTDTPAAAPTAEPMDSYSPEDRAFYCFWYGHMLNDLMQPPLAGISHATARYIWNAALSAPVAAQPAASTVTMRPMQFDDGRMGWYVDHPEFYADVEPDETTGRWTVFFRDKQGREAYGEQPAASGVDALWVNKTMELAARIEAAGARRGREGRAPSDHEPEMIALRTHLSTALTGAAKETK